MSEEKSRPRRPRHSRWSRLPTTYRSGDKRIPGQGDDTQRLTLYLPTALLDQAESLARRAGAESLQAYCEGLLAQAIQQADEEVQRARSAAVATIGDLEDDFVSQVGSTWTHALGHCFSEGQDLTRTPEEPPRATTVVLPSGSARRANVDDPQPADLDTAPAAVLDDPAEAAARLVLSHAGLAGDYPTGLIPVLRRGEPITALQAEELLNALVELERALADAPAINRRLAFALHRLAYEGQLLITDAWPGIAPEPATVETLRLVQEAVDRVLSGEDIRYYSAPPHEAGQPPLEDQFDE